MTSLTQLFKQRIIFGMTPNPEPQHPMRIRHSERSIRQTDADGSVFADFLELKGRMVRIGFKKFEVFVC